MTRADLRSPLAAMLCARDRARRMGDMARVRDLRWHLQVLWAHVGEMLTMVTEECAEWAAGGNA